MYKLKLIRECFDGGHRGTKWGSSVLFEFQYLVLSIRAKFDEHTMFPFAEVLQGDAIHKSINISAA